VKGYLPVALLASLLGAASAQEPTDEPGDGSGGSLQRAIGPAVWLETVGEKVPPA
jgi:hypothetical protein